MRRCAKFAGAVIAVLAMSVATNPLSAQNESTRNSLPRFGAFPARAFAGPKPPLTLNRDDMSFRTRYRGLYRSAPNFAGHYAIEIVGCGTECIAFLTVDLKRGKTAWLKVPTGEALASCPDEFRDENGATIFQDFYFRSNSRLFIVAGRMDGIECGARYFVEQDGEMKPIRDVHLKKPQ